MLRITTWRLTGTPPPNVTPQAALDAFSDMCGALEKLEGAGTVRWFSGNGGIVTVGELESYAVADTILASPASHAAVARVLALGYDIAEDHFLLERRQIQPFFDATMASLAGMTGPSRN